MGGEPFIVSLMGRRALSRIKKSWYMLGFAIWSGHSGYIYPEHIDRIDSQLEADHAKMIDLRIEDRAIARGIMGEEPLDITIFIAVAV